MKTIIKLKELANATENLYLEKLIEELEIELKKKIEDTKIETAHSCIDFGF